MARVKKPIPTFDATLFSTPEQKVLRLLLSEPTTSFTPRVISSKLKGIRGLGGVEGIMKILHDLQTLGFVDFVDNHRAARLQDDNSAVHILKTVAALCDIESLRKLLEPISTRGILFGSRAAGKARSDSDYDLFVVTDSPVEAKGVAESHPLGRKIEIVAWTPEMFSEIESQDSMLYEKISKGIVLWGPSW